MNRLSRMAITTTAASPCAAHRPSRRPFAQRRRGLAARTEFKFEQPLRLNRILYMRIIRALHPMTRWFALAVTAGVLIALGCKSLAGEDIPTSRWLLGATSGTLSSWCFRIAVLISVARPRIIVFRADRVCLSDIGTVSTDRIIHWSLDRDMADESTGLRCARLEIVCRGLLWDRRWSMLLDDNDVTERLTDALRGYLPRVPSWPPANPS